MMEFKQGVLMHKYAIHNTDPKSKKGLD